MALVQDRIEGATENQAHSGMADNYQEILKHARH